MSFERIDRIFAARPSRLIALECVGCGTTVDVAKRKPVFWKTADDQPALPLCVVCGLRPTAPDRLSM